MDVSDYSVVENMTEALPIFHLEVLPVMCLLCCCTFLLHENMLLADNATLTVQLRIREHESHAQLAGVRAILQTLDQCH